VPHGDADIGTLQGRRVVHPVAGHRRHLAVGLHRLDQAQLVLGAGAGEDVDLAHRLAERRFVHGFDLGAGQRPSPATRIPIARAMAAAVTAWSPVIILTRMPAA
jgi:hypothetical protein